MIKLMFHKKDVYVKFECLECECKFSYNPHRGHALDWPSCPKCKAAGDSVLELEDLYERPSRLSDRNNPQKSLR